MGRTDIVGLDMQDKTTLTLHQRANSSEEQHIELKSGRELHVSQRKNHKQTKYAFSILALSDEGQRVYRYQKRWLLLALLMIAGMPVIPHLQHYLPDAIGQNSGYVVAGLFFAALMFLLRLVQTFQHRDVFYSSHTRLPLVEFRVNLPSRKEYQHFISTLESRVKQHKQEMKINYDKQLAGELRTLRRVTEAGLLSESVYLAAKAKLLILSDIPHRPPAGQE